MLNRADDTWALWRENDETREPTKKLLATTFYGLRISCRKTTVKASRKPTRNKYRSMELVCYFWRLIQVALGPFSAWAFFLDRKNKRPSPQTTNHRSSFWNCSEQFNSPGYVFGSEKNMTFLLQATIQISVGVSYDSTSTVETVGLDFRQSNSCVHPCSAANISKVWPPSSKRGVHRLMPNCPKPQIFHR